MSETPASGPAGADFRTTRWSVILAARKSSSGSRESSLTTLCQAYWYPLYAYLRRKGYREEDAQDLVQDFFSGLIEKNYLNAVDPERGKFRWFLMDAIGKFAANWNAAQAAQKRGGDQKILSLDFSQGEQRYMAEPVDGWTPQRLFERRWAIELLTQAMGELEQQFEANGRQKVFDELLVFLTPDSCPPAYQSVADKLGLSLTAVKVAIHRLRDKYRDAVRQCVARTLDENESIDDEIDRLFNAMG